MGFRCPVSCLAITLAVVWISAAIGTTPSQAEPIALHDLDLDLLDPAAADDVIDKRRTTLRGDLGKRYRVRGAAESLIATSAGNGNRRSRAATLRGDLGKRARLTSRLRGDLGKRRLLDDWSEAAARMNDVTDGEETPAAVDRFGVGVDLPELEKRKMSRLRGDLGKRAGGTEEEDAMFNLGFGGQELDDKRAMKSSRLRGDLGKRARGKSALRGDLGKRALRFDLGKRPADADELSELVSDMESVEEEKRRSPLRGDLGKRSAAGPRRGSAAKLRSDLGKRGSEVKDEAGAP